MLNLSHVVEDFRTKVRCFSSKLHFFSHKLDAFFTAALSLKKPRRFEQQNSPPFTCVNSGLSFYIDAIIAYGICIKKMCLFVIGQNITTRVDSNAVEHLIVFVLLVAYERNTYTVSGVIE